MESYVDFDVNITKFIYARRKEHESTWVYEIKNRHVGGIVLFYKGTLEYNDGAASFRIFPNTVLWLPKGHSYTFKSVGNEEVGFIALSFLTDGGGLPFRMLRIPTNNRDIAVMFDEVLKLSLAQDVAYSLAVKSKVYGIIFSLLRLYTDEVSMKPDGYEGLDKSLAYIHQHLGEKISLTQLAKISGYSQSYYRRIFHAEYGMSPICYINQKRVEKAQKLLLCGLYSKSEIAQSCGFENQQFFARVFKKYTQKTPTDYCKTFEPEGDCEI